MIKIGNKTVLDIGIGGKAVQKVEIDDKIAYEMPDYLCFTDVSGAANTLSLTKTNTSSTISPDLEYSTDRLNWNTWTETEYVRSVSIPANGRVWLRGNCTGYNGDFRFSSTGNINADGDIMTIINKSGTTIVPYMGFASLFRSMSTLKKAPAINASHFERLACTSMFQACYNLNDVSNIKIINPTIGSAGNTIFGTMFADCSYLTSAPEISINNFWNHEHVFSATFNNCIRLTDISKLHITATVAPNNTFYHTFKGCTSLQTGLNISSVNTTGTTNVFEQMYNGCTSLTTAYAPTITWDTTKTIDWLNNVAASGTLIADDSISSTIPTNNTSGCPSGWSVSETHTYLCFTDVSGSANTLSLTKTGTPPSVSLEYSTDKNTWNTWTETEGVRSVTIPANGKVWLRGDNANGFAVDNDNIHTFSSTGNINADGDLMSIINKNGSNTVPASGFRKLFMNMTTLKKAPAINATTFNSYACMYIFQSCSGLTDVSNINLENFSLPDNSTSNLLGMFYQCSNLPSANVFKGATIPVAISAYRGMFSYCRALASVPSFTIEASTASPQLCFQMFSGCNNASFTDASGIHLNSTNLGWSCYYGMFDACSYLTNVPSVSSNISTISQSSISQMFRNCSRLETGLDIRNATSINSDSLDQMYDGCSSLTTAYAPTVTWDTANSNNWLNNVAASGTLIADDSIASTIPTNSVDGCPAGWTVQNN